MGVHSGSLATSGNELINPFSTGTAIPVNPVEKEAAGGDPIENLLPALLQIFLTVSLLTLNFILFLATLVALHFTPLSHWVSGS